MTSALRWVGGQHHAPAPLPQGNTRYPLYRRMGGPQGRSGLVRKISPPPGFDSRTFQSVASRYTDWVIAPITEILGRKENTYWAKMYVLFSLSFLLWTVRINVTQWHAPLNIVAVGSEEMSPVYCWATYVTVNNIKVFESDALKT